MYTRTILSKSYAVARSSTTSTLRPFFLTPIQSRNMASDRKSKSNPKIVETTDTVENTVEGAKQIAEEFGTTLDAMGKSDVGSGSGHGVPGQTGNPVYDAADKVGTMHNKGSDNPSVFSSGGAIGKQFNPDGNIGQLGEKVGGPFAKDGVIGRQFDASGGGIAGTVEKLVDGPAQKKPGEPGYKGPGKH